MLPASQGGSLGMLPASQGGMLPVRGECSQSDQGESMGMSLIRREAWECSQSGGNAPSQGGSQLSQGVRLEMSYLPSQGEAWECSQSGGKPA